MCLFYIATTSLVPAGSLEVVTADESGPVEAGSGDLTLTCTVREVISGLTNMPYALWRTASGPVTSGNNITLTETLRTDTHSTVTLSFSSLHTSHVGQYMCQGTLVSPAAENNITSTPGNVSVNVRCKCCGDTDSISHVLSIQCLLQLLVWVLSVVHCMRVPHRL